MWIATAVLATSVGIVPVPQTVQEAPTAPISVEATPSRPAPDSPPAVGPTPDFEDCWECYDGEEEIYPFGTNWHVDYEGGLHYKEDQYWGPPKHPDGVISSMVCGLSHDFCWLDEAAEALYRETESARDGLTAEGLGAVHDLLASGSSSAILIPERSALLTKDCRGSVIGVLSLTAEDFALLQQPRQGAVRDQSR